MEVGQDYEARWVLAGDLQLDLALHRDVVNGCAAAGDVELCRCIEIEEVGSEKIPADEGEPVDDPEQQRAYACASCGGVTKTDQTHGEPTIHRPLSRRRAKRSGSFALRITRWAPLMSYRTRRNSNVFASTSQTP